MPTSSFGIIRETQASSYLINAAMDALQRQLLAQRHEPDAPAATSPAAIQKYLTLKLATQPHEAFWVICLDGQNRVISMEELFRGTLSQTAVYPREVVKLAMQRNAAAVIFAHNHPSGTPEPSNADRRLTETLKGALALVDVEVLDHFVVGGTVATSFAEKGWL